MSEPVELGWRFNGDAAGGQAEATYQTAVDAEWEH